jgi:Rad3-related DNA helicase
MINFLSEQEGAKLWGHLDGFDTGQFRTLTDVEAWLETATPTKRTIALRARLKKNKDQFIIRDEEEIYRGHMRPCLRVIPLSPRDNKPIMWPPNKVRKIVLMSATFSKEDLYSLGLDMRRVYWVEVESPIPSTRRPIKIRPIANLSYYNQSTQLPAAIKWLDEALTNLPEKGLVHATYGLSFKLSALWRRDRVMYHNQRNKKEVYDRWLASDPAEGKVLVACGLYEGISLNEELARWQVILKIPYPNMKDPAVFAKMQARPESYQWDAIRQLVQAAGRVCRTPEDFGKTFIIDTGWNNLYSRYKHLFPKFFIEAIE